VRFTEDESIVDVKALFVVDELKTPTLILSSSFAPNAMVTITARMTNNASSVIKSSLNAFILINSRCVPSTYSTSALLIGNRAEF